MEIDENMVKNTNFYKRIARLLRAKEQIISGSLTFFFFKSDESDLLASLLCKEQRELVAHGPSFVKSNFEQ